MTYTSVLSTKMASVKRLVAASLAVIGLAVGIGATPANALGVATNGSVKTVIDVGGLIVELDVPVNEELTSEEIIALYDAIVAGALELLGGSVMDFKENIEGLLVDDQGRIRLLEFLEDLLQFTILPFLVGALDTLVGLVVDVKTNVDGQLDDGVCVTTGLKRLGSTCVTV